MAAVTPQVHSQNFNEEFRKGKPKALGIVTIVVAIVQVVLESVLRGIGVYALPSFISYWGPAFYIIAGSLAIAASNKQNIGLVKAAMVFNIIITILSAIALVLSIVNIVSFSLLLQRACATENDLCWRVIVGVTLFAIILFTNALLMYMSITISVFAGRASRQAAIQNSSQVFMIQNQTMVPVPQGTVPAFYPSYTQAQPPPPGYNVDYGTQKPAM